MSEVAETTRPSLSVLRAHALFWCFLLTSALLLRMAILPLAIDRSPLGDPKTYIQIAQNLLAGRGLVRDPIASFDTWRAHYPPLYPLLLGFVGFFTQLGPPTFLAINFLADVGVAFVLLWIAHLVSVPKVGKWAAIAYLYWPTNLLNAPIAQKESLIAFLTVLLIGAVLSAANRPRVPEALAIGGLTGILALAQPALLTLSPALALALRSKFRDRWVATMAIAVLASFVVMLPWWIRNWIVTHEFVPLTDSTGFALYVGNLPPGDGVEWYPLPASLRALPTGLEVGREATRQTFAWIGAHPTEFLYHNLSKAAAMIAPDVWEEKRLQWMLPHIAEPTLLVVSSQVSWVAMWIGAGAGMIVARHGVLWRVMVACLLQLFAIQLWFQFPERHSYFAVPVLLLMAAQVALDAIESFQRRRGLPLRAQI